MVLPAPRVKAALCNVPVTRTDAIVAIRGGRAVILQGWMSGRFQEAPVVIVNPASDGELAGLARGLTAEGDWTPETLQAELRRTFPKVIVHRRELSGERLEIYYVYREGRWIPPEPPDQ